MAIPGTSKFRVPMGPFDLWPQPNTDSAGRVRVSQQYAEVIEGGGSNKVRVSQQYAEVIESGSHNKVRVSQQYLELIVTFGTPPVPPKPKKEPPGQTKKFDKWEAHLRHHRQIVYTRLNGQDRYAGTDVALTSNDTSKNWIASLPQPEIKFLTQHRTIRRS